MLKRGDGQKDDAKAGIKDDTVYRLLKAIGPKDFLTRRELSTAAQNAIKFPLYIRSGRRWDAAEADMIREKFDVKDLLIVHGLAFEADERAVLIAGPQGIGKSTALRGAIRRRDIRVIDDGQFLLGITREGVAKAIETGVYHDQVRQGLSLFIRKTMGMRSPYIDLKGDGADEEEFRRRFMVADRIGLYAHAIGATLIPACLKRRDYAPNATLVSDFIYAVHERDPLQPILLPQSNEPVRTTLEAVAKRLSGGVLTDEANATAKASDHPVVRTHRIGLPDPLVREILRDMIQGIVGG